MSPSYAQFMSVTRIVVLCVVMGFSFIVISVNAAYAHTTLDTTLFVDGIQVWPQSSIDVFAALNLAVAALTTLTLPVLAIIDYCMQGAMVVVELSWLGVLDVLWIAAGAYTTDKFQPVQQFCSEVAKLKGVPTVHLACGTVQASMAFSFLNFIVLTVYIVMLLVLALIYTNKGVPVWTRSVRDAASTTLSPSSTSNAVNVDQEQYAMKVQTSTYETVSAVPSVPYTTQQSYTPTSYASTQLHVNQQLNTPQQPYMPTSYTTTELSVNQSQQPYAPTSYAPGQPYVDQQPTQPALSVSTGTVIQV